MRGRLLLTWSDRGADTPPPNHHVTRARSDRGPILRLLEQPESKNRYASAIVFTTARGRRSANALATEMKEHVRDVEVRTIDVEDPSDHGALFERLAPVAAEIERTHDVERDVLLSAGTPQMQTIWVILVQAGLLSARMLQVVPPAFVPSMHPRAVKEVSFDVDGFPEIRALKSEVVRLRAEVRARRPLVAVSEPMRALVERIARVAPSPTSVLVHGETGSGKELVARAIHDASPRASGPFVAENCGSFAEGVLASELFGHEAGAFTGAKAQHRGLFEQAHGGTIFLDEIGETSLRVQTMLLRVLEDGTLRRVGGEKTIRVDVRVIAATHRDLTRMVAEGRFREDLYYRLRGVVLEVPPLRRRALDLPQLVDTFLREACAAQKRPRPTITTAAMQALSAHTWPGNVRELRAEVHQWVVFAGAEVDVRDLSPEVRAEAPKSSRRAPRVLRDDHALTLREAVERAELEAMRTALARCDGNLLRTAKALAIERNTLKRKLKAFGLYPRRA